MGIVGAVPMGALLLALLGCTESTPSDLTAVNKTNNPPSADARFTNQSVATNQLPTQTNR